MISQRRLALFLLALTLLLNIVALIPDTTVSRVDLNDSVYHYPLIADMVRQMEHGGNPFDWWAPEWSMGYPVLRTYQPLAHLLVALSYFALFKSVSLMTVFVWARFLAVVLLPVTFFVTARLLSLSWMTAAASAMLAPLVSSAGLFGIEYGSYVWAGIGVFTQAVATHFFLLAIGFGYRALRRGTGLAVAGILTGLTFLAHFIFGYMAALTLCLLALIPNRETPLLTRAARTAWIGAIAFILAAFELLPLLLDSAIINHSRWEPVWKWDSFGAGPVMKLLLTGDILDHGRFPVMTLLAVTGLVVYLLDRSVNKYPARTFIALGAALWLLMFFGRPFWGPVLTLVGVPADLQLHRVCGGAQVFLVFLAAIGLAGLWKFLRQRTNTAVTILATVILFLPMTIERGKYLRQDYDWGQKSLAAYNANKTAIDAAISIARDRGGRVFAGLAAAWGGKFKIGDPPVYAYFSTARVPALSFMYHSMSLTSETMTRFNQDRPAHYRLFDLQTVIAPQGMTLAKFLIPIVDLGPMRVYAAPGGGYFDVVDAFYAVRTTKDNFYDVNDRWQQSVWLENRQYLLIDLFGTAPPNMPHLNATDPLPPSPNFPYPGAVTAERNDTQDYQAEIDAGRRCYVLFKMTWHPNWHATVDGQPVKTVMLSPGFTGIPVPPGHHSIDVRYEPERWKSILAIVGLFLVGLIAVGEWRGFAPSFRFTLPDVARPAWLYPALGVIALSLPLCVGLAAAKLPLGHDATEYLPRIVEFHQNIVHGILLPRWAPDLSRGTGQPLFLFNPPMFYYLAEIFHLFGFGIVQSINLACALIVLGSAAGMFLLGRLYFGNFGGYLAAAAYIYAPYFAVDLYVRSALAEYAAFPFFAFALYGFGAYAKYGARKYLAIGAAAFAGVFLCHNGAALLFAPMLGAFIALQSWFAKSWRLFFEQCAGIALALALSAFVWFPSLVENGYVQVQTLLTSGYSNYMNHFVYLHQLFSSPWGYGLSVAGDKDGMSFELGWTHLILIAIALVCIRKISQRRWFWFFGAVAVVFCWMILPAAQPVWDRVRLLQYIAFPWRWLGPIAVAVAMCAAALGSVIEGLGKYRNAAFAAALAFLIAPNLSHLHPNNSLAFDDDLWTPASIARNNVAATNMGEYRPRWMSGWPTYNPHPAEVVAGYATYQQTGKTPISWAASVDASSPATLQLSTAYFPGWNVQIDGKTAGIWPSDPMGLIRFDVPQGRHLVVATLRRTPALVASDLISLFAFAILVGLVLYRPRKAANADSHAQRAPDLVARDSENSPKSGSGPGSRSESRHSTVPSGSRARSTK